MLAERFVFAKNQGGFDTTKIEKMSHRTKKKQTKAFALSSTFECIDKSNSIYFFG